MDNLYVAESKTEEAATELDGPCPRSY